MLPPATNSKDRLISKPHNYYPAFTENLNCFTEKKIAKLVGHDHGLCHLESKTSLLTFLQLLAKFYLIFFALANIAYASKAKSTTADACLITG
jgi:hypothetical protein